MVCSHFLLFFLPLLERPKLISVLFFFFFFLSLPENVKLKAECETLQKEVNALISQLAVLEQKVAQGEFDPSKTKVLHLSMNPEKIAQEERAQTMAGLKVENEQLAKRIQELLEHAGGKERAPQTALPLIGEGALAIQQKSQLLEKKLQETEIKMQRLKEVSGCLLLLLLLEELTHAHLCRSLDERSPSLERFATILRGTRLR